MGNEKFQNRYRIPSARASWHDYGDGAYYVTICTAHHEHYFGEIADSVMHLSAIGQFVANNLQNVSAHYPYAGIPLFVVMPNHLHAIVFIDGNKIPSTRGAPENDSSGKNIKMQEIANQSGWFSICIGGIKSAVTKYAHENNINFEFRRAHSPSALPRGKRARHQRSPIRNRIPRPLCGEEFQWQSRFHDHIIRDTDEMNQIVDYIENNVARWESDQFYINLYKRGSG